MFEAIQSATGNPILDELMVLIAVYLILVVPVTLVVMYLAGCKRPALLIFATAVAAIALAQVLGLAYYHDPPHLQGYETILENDPENAFPSNHAAAAFGFAAGVLYVRFRRLGILAVVAAALIGLARVYTGLHFPIDIAGGVFVAVVAVGVVHALREPVVDRLVELGIAIEERLLDATVGIEIPER